MSIFVPACNQLHCDRCAESCSSGYSVPARSSSSAAAIGEVADSSDGRRMSHDLVAGEERIRFGDVACPPSWANLDETFLVLSRHLGRGRIVWLCWGVGNAGSSVHAINCCPRRWSVFSTGSVWGLISDRMVCLTNQVMGDPLRALRSKDWSTRSMHRMVKDESLNIDAWLVRGDAA